MCARLSRCVGCKFLNKRVVKLFITVILLLFIYIYLIPWIHLFEELSKKECVTSADCQRLYPHNTRKRHCEIGKYICVGNCVPTRHERWIERNLPPKVQTFLFDTSDVWRKLSQCCKMLTALCSMLIVYVTSWGAYFKAIIKSPVFIIGTLIAIPFIQEIVKFVIPHRYIDFLLTWSLFNINKFRNSLNLGSKSINEQVQIKSAFCEFICICCYTTYPYLTCSK